jgi:zeaxanthin glucosyltransferase
MKTIAIVTLPLMGHMRPMLAGAYALRRAGHHPVIVGPADLVARLPEDISSKIIGEHDLKRGDLDAMCACLSRMTSWGDVRQMLHVVGRLSQFYLDHLPGALSDLGADSVLHDQLEPAAGLVARGLGRTSDLRHISLACALPMNRDWAVPPPLMGWRYRPGAYGAWLNAGYYRVTNWLLREQGQALAAGASRFGLEKAPTLPDWQRPWSIDDGLSSRHDLVQGLASLDYPRSQPPTYLGPFRDLRQSYPGLASIAAERDGRPLAFISLGSLMGGRQNILIAMAQAASARGLQPVMVHGGRWIGDQSALPKGTICRDFLDQREILSDASIALIHGGYNSTTDAVGAGVPLVMVPLAFDQSAIAARVERAQVGRTVSGLGPCLSQRIRFAIGDVLGSETVHRAVRQTRFEAMAAPGASGLVTAVEGADPVPTAAVTKIKSIPTGSGFFPEPAE